MAEAAIKEENDVHEGEERDNLSEIKEVTQEVDSYRFDDHVRPVFTWRLLGNLRHENAVRSDLFPFRDHIARLTLIHLEDQWNLTLSLFRPEVQPEVEDPKESHSAFFVCRFKHYDAFQRMRTQRCDVSTKVFDASATKQEFHFRLKMDSPLVVIELLQEPLTRTNSVSPYHNMAMGAIEKFSEAKRKLYYDHFPVVSPRFVFDSSDQPLVVRFWHAKLDRKLEQEGLSATLHFLKQDGGPEVAFMVTFTLFSAKTEVENLVNRVIFQGEKGKSEYPVFLAFYFELDAILDAQDDTLFYKLVIEKINMI